jgi:endonuclease/exonuclease/phosphatase family metal-dependent hydrolase
MTFNIRYGDAEDGKHHWRHRKGLTLETIRAHDPDLLGLQEPTREQWDWIAAGLPDHRPFGHDRTDRPDADPQRQGGFLRDARFETLTWGIFWLSETPGTPGSVDWPNDWGARACGWVRLRDRDAGGREFVFACTHLDTNAGAWLPSAKVLTAELNKVAPEIPLILVGDFNCAAGSQAHRYLLSDGGFRDAWNESGHADEAVVTFNAFTTVNRLDFDDLENTRAWLEAHTKGIPRFLSYPKHVLDHRNYRIDWILLRGRVRALGALTDHRHADGLLPSDHYPVLATLDWTD